MADFSKIFEQAQQMQARMQQMQSELEKQTVTAALLAKKEGLADAR